MEQIIVAPATSSGGALALVRLSGEGSIALCDRLFRGRVRLTEAPSHTLHYGALVQGEEPIDDVVVSLFRAPHSYTGEESVEISCHGSSYIVNRILEALITLGARMATAGEFTMRAFLNGRIDLMQAEAVADLIRVESQTAHKVASAQLRGDYSMRLSELRAELVKLASLLELELDFSEEDVEFASREGLRENMVNMGREIERLKESFRLGNALKRGVAVAIVGEPNVGKSTLLNRLVGEERALVSELAGTTRDTIEEQITIDGLRFRFIDTAGLRESGDQIELMGMERTRKAISEAYVILHVVDAQAADVEPVACAEGQHLLTLRNKADRLPGGVAAVANNEAAAADSAVLYLSAKSGEGLEELRRRLRSLVDTTALERGDVVITNSRHAEALHHAELALQRAISGLDEGLTTDLLAEELRQVAHHIGCITNEISSDDLLQSIFSSFCIGK